MADTSILSSLGIRNLGSQRVKVVATAVSAALFGTIIWLYYRRKKKKSTQPSVKPKSDGSASIASRRGPSPARGLPARQPSQSSLTAYQRRRGSASRSTSGSAVDQVSMKAVSATGTTRTIAIVHAGVESLSDSVTNFERAIRILRDTRANNRQEREVTECLENSLETVRRIQSDINKLIERYWPEALEEMSTASTLTPMGSQYAIYDGASQYAHVRRTLSVLSDDSFVSALDDLAPSFPDVEAPVREVQTFPFEDLALYQTGWTKAQNGEVQCRTLRTDFLHCLSDDDFLAKLHCVREALAIVMADESKRCWIADAGRDLICALLQHAGKDSIGFCGAYNAMLEFVNNTEDWSAIQDELSYREVKQITFYDVVLDFILMDAFDDLVHPPGSVLAVAQNRFLSASFKEKTLNAVVWSVIKAKRTRLQYSRGFIAHFYDISEQVSPTMAWGFLGTDEGLREVCYYFKDQVCNFLMDIFSVDRVRYTNVEDLATDIYQVCQCRMTTTHQRLSPKADNASHSPNHLDNGNEMEDTDDAQGGVLS